MSDAAPVGTPSTPATGEEAAAAAAPASSAPSTETQPVAKPADPAATAPAAPSSPTDQPAPAAKPADPKPAEPVAKPPETKDPAAPVQPLFSLPDDVKLIDGSREKFEAFLKAKLVDGKVPLTPQEVLDHFLEHARDANNLWVKQQQDNDAANAAACKQRFTEAQLAEAETGVGFLASYEPAFREVAKAFQNHPSFVAAMRLVGNLLSEDTFEPGGGHREPASKRAADIMYPNQGKK